ncbi:uncharacterized protein KGF55_005762 [Candida pseudojiufengensis]|uniref:uncharacterized protein n=1 Tax=Candida pseudojiufengensis TaxID=497109 RepID=UPI0022253853|nr:uncharacterized protein KGF55_005762 [Candida pseudojiufengensis]KAI5958502.1 hypothetical protein KGF55_005762 [Candida pseudojiufengensis]
MSSFIATGFKGLIAGSIVTPIVTKYVISPMYFDPQVMKEIHYIQQEMEFVGWNVRHLQEQKGFKEEELYTPNTFYAQSSSHY